MPAPTIERLEGPIRRPWPQWRCRRTLDKQESHSVRCVPPGRRQPAWRLTQPLPDCSFRGKCHRGETGEAEDSNSAKTSRWSKNGLPLQEIRYSLISTARPILANAFSKIDVDALWKDRAWQDVCQGTFAANHSNAIVPFVGNALRGIPGAGCRVHRRNRVHVSETCMIPGEKSRERLRFQALAVPQGGMPRRAFPTDWLPTSIHRVTSPRAGAGYPAVPPIPAK